jgi:hypothetical protein
MELTYSDDTDELGLGYADVTVRANYDYWRENGDIVVDIYGWDTISISNDTHVFSWDKLTPEQQSKIVRWTKAHIQDDGFATVANFVKEQFGDDDRFSDEPG